MPLLQEVRVGAQLIDRFLPLVGQERLSDAHAVAEEGRKLMAGRVLWTLNSTALGGGVAEMLRSLLAYVRGVGVDARWLVISGPPEFFRITKRIHHSLHGSPGDGSPLGEAERATYERVLAANAEELLALVRPRDLVLLHDPQTAGLAPHLARAGAIVVWRCHVGGDEPSEEVEAGWEFLAPYLEEVHANVFSSFHYIPTCCDHGRSVVIPPSIDAFSAKNQEMDEATVRSVLAHAGLVAGPPPGETTPSFVRETGEEGRVERRADLLAGAPAPVWETPLVVQVSRWDPLKDPLGVMHGFASLVDAASPAGAELVLAGPDVHAIADDPEGHAVLDAVVAAWRRLPDPEQRRVHIASLPMHDIEENAAIVNALQRHATIVVQKSIHEGFGLTVAEAMWKARPVVGSAVGGIQEQITHGVNGILIHDPTDLDAFAAAVRRLLEDPGYARQLGENARERVRQEYLGLRHLTQYVSLFQRLDQAPAP